MLLPLPTNNASLGSAAPYWFPKAEGCSGMPLFVFGCAQRLHGCCPALALSAGHGPRNRVCKPLGGFNGCSNTAIDGGEATL
jgi:hypothetical protein